MSNTRELSVTRYIDAPPEIVWDILANRQDEWFCPKPWQATVDVQEQRPGGRTELTFHGPEGESFQQNGIFLAFDEGRRFVVTDAVNGDLEPQEPFMIGFWEIAPEGDGTRYTAGARHWTDEAVARHKEMGFETGWSICANQLAELAEEAKADA